jgi:hypothetical protein
MFEDSLVTIAIRYGMEESGVDIDEATLLIEAQ